MVVVILESVPKTVRGELTRWLLELRAGVFAGNVSAIVRDKLWEVLCSKLKGGNAVLLHSAANEQGFLIRTHGESNYKVRDFDGLQLITIKEKSKIELTHKE
jgi:CRISPR-associated protein Cas2